jgi:hypothetical protein
MVEGRRTMARSAFLLVLGAALLGSTADTTIDFEFRNPDGVVYRTTLLASQLPGLTPRVLVIRAPSADDSRLWRQEQLLAERAEELQILLVTSLENGATTGGYFTDSQNSKRVAAALGSSRFALLDASGRVVQSSPEPISPSEIRPPLQRSPSLEETRQELVLATLLRTLSALYPGPDSLSCKMIATEEETDRFVQVAVRENHQAPCTGDPATGPVIDRLRIAKLGQQVDRYDSVQDKWLPVQKR